MYAILSNGRLVALCDKPRYVKIKKETGVFVETSKEDAIAVAVNGTLYNINGGDAIAGADQAVIREENAGEFIFGEHMRVTKNKEDADTAFIAVEGVVCELDTVTDARISNVETALCELDEMINGGGETNE